MKFFYESELNPSIFRTPFTDMAVTTNNCITIIRLLLVNVHYTSLHLVNKMEVYHYIKLNSSFNLQKLIYTQKLKTHNITKIKNNNEF